jgi:hypothetical protein
VTALGFALLAGCDGDDPGATASVTYHRDVRPLVERSCTSCHYAGGPTPYDFTAASQATTKPAWASAAVAAVTAGTMPPWMASDDCRDLRYERTLSDEERAVFSTWKDEGFAMGEASDFAALPPIDSPEPAGEPSLVLSPTEPYAPDPESVDDYRCFLLPQDFPTETYVVGSSVTPGQLSIAHHALIYLIPPATVAAIEDADGADGKPGYTCFGGPGGGALTTIGAWVPGAVPQVSTDGSAKIIPAGSRLVLQMHYNTLALGAGTQAPADQSKVELWTTTDKPAYRLEALPLAHLAMEIAPFEAAEVEQRTYSLPADGTIVGVAPHMHVLGTSIDVAIESGGADQCLVDVPRWDFHWQQQYTLADDAVVDAKKGDQVTVTCTYDNSVENQPLVDGAQKMPETVWWGEGTLDEMCLAYVTLKVPFDAPDLRCGAYPACQPTCADGDGHCFFDCLTVGGGQCAPCMLSGVFQCAPGYCAQEGLALRSCTEKCGPDVGSSCLLYQCGAEWDAFYACMEPHLEGGDCNSQLAECSVAF